MPGIGSDGSGQQPTKPENGEFQLMQLVVAAARALRQSERVAGLLLRAERERPTGRLDTVAERALRPVQIARDLLDQSLGALDGD